MLVIIPYNLSSVKPYKVLRFAIYDQRIANERMIKDGRVYFTN